MMVAPIARLSDGLRALPRPLRAGLWIGSALALLYALTLLTEGRTDREWMSPPSPSKTAVAPAEPSAWADAPAQAPVERAAALLAPGVVTGPAGAPHLPPDAVAPSSSPPPGVQTAKPKNREMKARRSTRTAMRRVHEPIQFRLADRPGH